MINARNHESVSNGLAGEREKIYGGPSSQQPRADLLAVINALARCAALRDHTAELKTLKLAEVTLGVLEAA